MSSSSELSDALNPYFYQQGRQNQADVPPDYDHQAHNSVSSPPAVPQRRPLSQAHRSELADAINPAAVSTSAREMTRRSTRQAAQDPIQLLNGLIQSIASYKAAVEQEKKRRLNWEREQEAKYITRQVELEKRVAELQNELDMLKAEYALPKTSSSRTSNPAHESSDTNASPGASQALVPGESVLLFTPTELPEFMEGSSAPAMVPQQGSHSRSLIDSSEQEPRKPRILRGSRVQTVQAAMRVHILECMDLDHDKELPPSHDETTFLPPTYPVRFVWDETTKKSLHNARMKTRILTDMIKNKQAYPLIPPEEFTLAKLDGVFEQSYTTLRQKYAAQQGHRFKGNYQDRSGNKARKARRLSRKKTKLTNRTTTRKGLSQYEAPEFDFAFQLDCMSSEESSEGETGTPTSSTGDKPPGKALRIRFLAWRSSRLKALFRAIDEHEQNNRHMKPKRGVGRKDRYLGPPKDGNPPPPKGIPRWMVSKKWLRQAATINPQITTFINFDDGRDESASASALAVLGEESEDEPFEEEIQNRVIPGSDQPDFTQMQMPDYLMVPPMLSMDPNLNPDPYQQAQYMYAQHTMWPDSMAGYVDVSQFTSSLMQPNPPGVYHST